MLRQMYRNAAVEKLVLYCLTLFAESEQPRACLNNVEECLIGRRGEEKLCRELGTLFHWRFVIEWKVLVEILN